MKINKLTSGVIADKVVAVRVDFNVPLKNGVIMEDTRIVESIPTLKYLLDNNAKQIHIFSHMGRPKGRIVPALSLKIVLKKQKQEHY